ncbi:hypothetical protein ACOT81_14880 [Streptomyces sp. WI04-05B]|uniref:hypothetical protein n=1 Tax=Streptomyces TaxID=1883 RepID=UPI0029B40F83|nr:MULTISPECIES: hypothetical protein [unclassified Streptomyces]MDX2540340.1 hypothetical protein [Streptomyces sp. WI04-05B]MDX2585227.1 hypothetical protein [Streptomyces sp. WI04-05A]MDX3752363.1 hypothetical protein [Streptomyces sp. AK08-02]
MGVYLVDVGAEEWFDEDEDEGGRAKVAVGLNAELVRRGLPRYDSVPAAADFVRGSGRSFEEKLVPPMDGLTALCEAHLSAAETETLLGWSVLVPVSLDEEIELPVESSYSDNTVIAGAPQVLAIAEKLARAVELPPEVPEMCDNLDLTMWFLDGEAEKAAATAPGPWSEDLDASFYVALYLRAAQHSLRRGCPVVYS